MVTDDCLEDLSTDALFRAIRDRCSSTPGAGAIALGASGRPSDLTLDLGTGLATWGPATANLSGREAQLLAALMIAHPHGATGAELGWRVWRDDAPENARVYVRYLRGHLPGLIPLQPALGGVAQPYRLAVDAAAVLTGAVVDAAAAFDPAPVAPPRTLLAEPTPPAIAAGDEAFVWQQKFNRAYDRMFALECAFSARLMRHNAGPGVTACDCAECAWLRSLFSSTLPARQSADAERTITVTTETNETNETKPEANETDSATRPDRSDPICRPSFERIAQQRLAEVEREHTAVVQQLAELLARERHLLAEEAATRAAVEAYARAMAGPVPVADPVVPSQRRRRAPRGREPGGSILPMLLEMAQGGATVQRAAAIARAAELGVTRTTVHRALVDSGRFERVGVGMYRLKDAAA